MTTNADITVYNSFLNPDTRLKEWRRTVIKKAWFYVDNKVSVTDGGLASADSFKVRIPVDAEFPDHIMLRRKSTQARKIHGP